MDVGSGRGGEEMPACVTSLYYLFLNIGWTVEKKWNAKINLHKKEQIPSLFCSCYYKWVMWCHAVVSQHRDKGWFWVDVNSSSRKGLAGTENPEVDGEGLMGATVFPHLGVEKRSGSSVLNTLPTGLIPAQTLFWHHPAHSQVATLCATEDPVNPLNQKPVLWSKPGWICWFKKIIDRILSFWKLGLIAVHSALLLASPFHCDQGHTHVNCSP